MEMLIVTNQSHHSHYKKILTLLAIASQRLKTKKFRAHLQAEISSQILIS